MFIPHAEAIDHAEKLLRSRDLDAALEALKVAEAFGASPDRCCAERWTAHMLRGAFAQAWIESDAICGRGAPDQHRFWQGEDLRGKRVILRCLHGLGDAVQLLRYVPALQSLAESLVIEVPPAFLELAPYFAGVGEVITWGSTAPAVPPNWDVQIEINELPYLFRTTAEELPLATNYLHLPSASLKANPPKPNSSSSRRVGLVWASGAWNPSRSVPFDLLHPILTSRGCEFWNLQGGSERERWSELSPGPHLHDATSCAHSLLALATTIAQLDVVITTDTLAAHLAGALGVQAWVMLDHAADWRWQHARDDSPWYPSLRLFRQRHNGDWPGVIASVAADLMPQHSRRGW